MYADRTRQGHIQEYRDENQGDDPEPSHDYKQNLEVYGIEDYAEEHEE